MKKHEALAILKSKFRDVNNTIQQIKEIKDLYNEIKEINVKDKDPIPMKYETKIRSIS